MTRRVQQSMKPHPERGAVLVLVAVSMVALLGVVALAVDLGYLFVTRNEVQNVADGSALAGARDLGAQYQSLSDIEQQAFYCDGDCQERIRDAARNLASMNRAGGLDMTLLVGDILIGRWSGGTFTPTNEQPDAVSVVGRRDKANNGPISSFFARVLGIDETSVNALAVAAMTGLGETEPGEVELPIGIDEHYFRQFPEGSYYCGADIQFSPTKESCAGWTTWEYWPSNDETLEEILEEKLDSPGIITFGSEFVFSGGNQSQKVFYALVELYKQKGCATDANDNFLGGTGACIPFDEAEANGGVPWIEEGESSYWPELNPPYKATSDQRYYHRWDTTVPVYADSGCDNPNQTREIVGFARVELTDVRTAPDKTVTGKIVCNVVNTEDTRGGGSDFGIKGPIPGLVR